MTYWIEFEVGGLCRAWVEIKLNLINNRNLLNGGYFKHIRNFSL